MRRIYAAWIAATASAPTASSPIAPTAFCRFADTSTMRSSAWRILRSSWTAPTSRFLFIYLLSYYQNFELLINLMLMINGFVWWIEIQAYTINAAKVLFIKKRPQNRQFKGAANYCTSCDRSLQEPFIHCSLGCKVHAFPSLVFHNLISQNHYLILWFLTLIGCFHVKSLLCDCNFSVWVLKFEFSFHN